MSAEGIALATLILLPVLASIVFVYVSFFYNNPNTDFSKKLDELHKENIKSNDN